VTSNQLPAQFPNERERKILVDLYGEKAVEYAMIAIQHAYNRRGLRVMIRPEANRIRAVLEAIYGRPGVNEVWL
jgi:hypothetical protein